MIGVSWWFIMQMVCRIKNPRQWITGGLLWLCCEYWPEVFVCGGEYWPV